MAKKSPQAFRTISEVSNWLETPTHVLRFWESRFKQIKPVKRAGGRRYYRPKDMALIGGIKVLLHEQGYTIAAVQQMLKANPKQVANKAPMTNFIPKDEEQTPVAPQKIASSALMTEMPIGEARPKLNAENLCTIRDLYQQLGAVRDRMAAKLKDV